MAIIYDNFDEAWTAKENLYTAYNNVSGWVDGAKADILAAGSWPALRTATYRCCNYLHQMLTSLSRTGRDPLINDPLHACIWYANQSGNGGEIDMASILDAMWKSDKTQSFEFINDIDAMRASIWNTEIYESSLENWYRHFSI